MKTVIAIIAIIASVSLFSGCTEDTVTPVDTPGKVIHPPIPG